MSHRKGRQLVVAGIIERNDNHILISRAEETSHTSDRAGCWQFPRGVAAEGESPEQSMRHFAREALGLVVEVVTGQPPLVEEIDGQRCEFRYFFCGVVSGEVDESTETRLRWLPKAHLREYDFDAASQPVVQWLLEG